MVLEWYCETTVLLAAIQDLERERVRERIKENNSKDEDFER